MNINPIKIIFSVRIAIALLASLGIVLLNITPSPAQITTPVGTAETLGTIEEVVTIELKVQGPAGQDTPLQVACLFEYTEGDIFNSPPALPDSVNGMVHLDKALHGLITEIRKSGRFQGYALETLLLIPTSGTIPAKRLLLIGLGERTEFKAELMEEVATVAYREADRLGVVSFSYASDLKDAGVDSPTAQVATEVVEGLAAAYRTQRYLQQLKVSPPSPLSKVTILSGPSFFEATKQAITMALATLPHD